MLATAPPSSIFLSLCPMADQVHQFKGVHYVPIKAIRDSERKWLSAGWLSKQMTLNNYNKTKPANIGIAVNPVQGSRVGDYMVLEEAINCVPLPKQAEARRFFSLAMEEATHDGETWCRSQPTTMTGALVCSFFGTWMVKKIIFPPSTTN